MRNSSILLAGVAALLCTDVALAQSVVPNTGFYIGVGLGKSHARLKTEDFSTGDPNISEAAHNIDTGYKAFVANADNWRTWPWLIVPAAVVGLLLSLRLWNARTKAQPG